MILRRPWRVVRAVVVVVIAVVVMSALYRWQVHRIEAVLETDPGPVSSE